MDYREFLAEWHNDSPKVLVHTSGSTGKPKPMWVEKRRMEASARITCQFLRLREGDIALLCLPGGRGSLCGDGADAGVEHAAGA